MNLSSLAAMMLLLIPCAPPPGGDWPQFLGPRRDGVYEGEVASWGEGGPRRLWERKAGQGFSAPVVSGEKLVLFHRVSGQERLDCLDAGSGRVIWSQDEPSAYHDDSGFDEGPRATPAIADGRVHAFGAEGLLRTVDLETGKKAWSIDARGRFGAPKGYFGAACSPLVEGGKVLLDIGGKAGIAAFDAKTGDVLWTAPAEEASYSSPVVATIGGRRQVLFFTRSGLKSLDPVGGEVLFHFPWRARGDASVNAATPIVRDDLVFISASYGTGAALLRIRGNVPEKVWSSDEALSSHYATCVLHEGALYGFDGRQESGPALRAVDLATGKVLWSRERFGAGTITLAGGRLLVLTEKGDLLLAPASRAGFDPMARARILPGTVRAYPALAKGRLYARNEETLVCLDLRPSSP